jgi:tRNA-dihydrouridine synthase
MSKARELITPGSIFFAPMEGVTNSIYRTLIQELYPQWDFLATDFLRIPHQGIYPEKHILKHFGKELFSNEEMKKKTFFQVLTSSNANNSENLKVIDGMGFPWIDLNLGCPSNTVCKKKGGSYLLSDLLELKSVLEVFRKNISGIFSVKIRVGFHDDSLFDEIIKVIEGSGVDLIIIHGRTRVQLYKGVANWEYIKRAKEISQLPIIGNGDIWTVKDAQSIQQSTLCDGIMLGRGALKRPWFARDYYGNPAPSALDSVKQYLSLYHGRLVDKGLREISILKQLKRLIRYPLDDLPRGAELKKNLYLSQNLDSFFNILQRY